MTTETSKQPIPKPAKGFARKWVACRHCQRRFYYDYQPYSLSNPILTLPCGHGVGAPFHERVREVPEPKWARERAR